MGGGCMKVGTLAVNDGRTSCSVGNEMDGFTEPQPSTSGLNGAVVHANARGRDVFMRPDLQRENLITSSDSELDLAPDDRLDEDEADLEERAGVLLVQAAAEKLHQMSDSEWLRKHSVRNIRHQQAQTGRSAGGAPWLQSGDGRNVGGGGGEENMNFYPQESPIPAHPAGKGNSDRLKVHTRRPAQSCEITVSDDNNTSNGDDDTATDMAFSDTASVVSAGMFEHVAKMSRISQHKPPSGALPLRFLSTAVITPEVYDDTPSDVIVNGADVTHTDGEQMQRGVPRVKLRTNVLGAKLSSYQFTKETPPASRRHSQDLSLTAKTELQDTDKDEQREDLKVDEPRKDSQVDEPTKNRGSDSRRQSVSECSEHQTKDADSGRQSPHTESYNRSDEKHRSSSSRHSKHRSRSRMRRSRRRDDTDSSVETSQRYSRPGSADGSQQGGSPKHSQRRSPDDSRKESRHRSPDDSQRGSRQRSADSSRRVSRQASQDRSSSIENLAEKERNINKQRHRSRDRDNYDHKEYESNRERESGKSRHKRKKKNKVWRSKAENDVNGLMTPPTGATAKRMADIRSQRWKKKQRDIENWVERKHGRNMRAAPRHPTAQVLQESAQHNDHLLLERLLQDLTAKNQQNTEVQAAAKELIDTEYQALEKKAAKLRQKTKLSCSAYHMLLMEGSATGLEKYSPRRFTGGIPLSAPNLGGCPSAAILSPVACSDGDECTTRATSLSPKHRPKSARPPRPLSSKR